MVHLGSLGLASDWEHRGLVVGVDLVILVASLIAGRVFPMFTRNATRQESVRGAPSLDVASLVAMALLRLLEPPRSATGAFVLVTVAAVFRVIVPLAVPEWTRPSLLVAGVLFASAFGLLLVGYTRMLLSPRVDGKAG